MAHQSLSALYPYRSKQILTTAVATVTVSIPANLHGLSARWSARADGATTAAAINLRINNDTTANYFGQYITTINVTTNAPVNTSAGTTARVGAIPGASAGAGVFAAGELSIPAGMTAHTKLDLVYRSQFYDTAANSFLEWGGWQYAGSTPFTSLVFVCGSGNFVANSEFMVEGWY